MKPETTEDILEIMNGSLFAAVLCTAMELGIFWRLADQSRSVTELAQSLNIPVNRCHYLLQILFALGLLEEGSAGYVTSRTARQLLLDVQDRETWAFQAREDRDLSLYVQDLTLNIHKPISAWDRSNPSPVEYFQQIEKDPTYVAGFTRKLYQIHKSLAEKLADLLDLGGINRLLDLGGGSGVVSFALLRKRKELTAVVVDVESVCQTGRRIAQENKLESRITYRAADILKDDLPLGFDMVMLCDVGIFSEILLRKIYDILNPGGQLVIVDKFAPLRTNAPPSRLLSAFLTSLESPAESADYITLDVVQTRLKDAGFHVTSRASVPHENTLPWNVDWSMLQARKK